MTSNIQGHGGPGAEPEPETGTVGNGENPVLLFLGVSVSLVFFLQQISLISFFLVFSAYFTGILRVRKVRQILDVFEVFPWFFKRTKEKKDRGFPKSRTQNRNRRNRFPGNETGTGTVLSAKLYWNTRKPPSLEEPPEPKTGTARTVPSPNRNRTEPGPPWILDNCVNKITIKRRKNVKNGAFWAPMCYFSFRGWSWERSTKKHDVFKFEPENTVKLEKKHTKMTDGPNFAHVTPPGPAIYYYHKSHSLRIFFCFHRKNLCEEILGSRKWNWRRTSTSLGVNFGRESFWGAWSELTGSGPIPKNQI